MAGNDVRRSVAVERDFVRSRQQAARAVSRGAQSEQRLLDPPDVPGEYGCLRKGALAEVEIDRRSMDEAKAAVYPRTKGNAELLLCLGRADQGTLLHIFIQPAFAAYG